MIPYYSPNYHLFDFVKSLFVCNAKKRTEEYFVNVTGKKYVLLTNSCRSALYLAYKSIPNQNTVITSPLSCRAALDPILEAGKRLQYAKVNTNDFNIDLNSVQASNSVIQINYQGGLLFESFTGGIKRLKNDNNFIVEDCAQSFMSFDNHTLCGSLGDVSCFSLIKNAYGIGGGILATDNYKLYLSAKKEQQTFKKGSNKLILFRIVRNIVESKRDSFLGESIYQHFMRFRTKKKNNSKNELFEKQLKLPSVFYFKTFCVQKKKFSKLHSKRRKNAIKLLSYLYSAGLINYNPRSFSNYLDASYTKLFISNIKFDAKKIVRQLNKAGIEAKHLEHSYKVFYQESFLENKQYNFFQNQNVNNYSTLHRNVISIPLYETMTDAEMVNLVNTIKNILNNE